MTFKSFFAPVIVEDEPLSRVAVDFATGLAATSGGHLQVMLGAPRLTAPGGLLPGQVHAMLDAANGDRRNRAEAFRTAIEAAPAGAAISSEIVQVPYLAMRDRLVAGARASDLVVLAPSGEFLSNRQDIMRAILFGCGRPVLLVPPAWTTQPRIQRVVVAWDGGGPAARALGDAMPFIEAAEQVEIVCFTPDKGKSTDKASVAAHVARHNRATKLSELPIANGDVGASLRDYAKMTRADLVVMGAYGHSRLWEMTLGGVTQTAIENTATPTLVSH